MSFVTPVYGRRLSAELVDTRRACVRLWTALHVRPRMRRCLPVVSTAS